MQKFCVEFGCNYPEGECAGVCHRNATVASNGNTGEHYGRTGSVRLTIIDGGKVDLEYIAHFNGDRRDVLERAGRLIQSLIKEGAKC